MDIYQHFREEEHYFIDQVLSWKEEVERIFKRKLTDFLNPREQQIVEMLIGTDNDDLNLSQFGGGSYSERKRAIIAPFYEELTNEDHQLSLLEGTYNSKFTSLEHPDVMGAFLSLGIQRKTLGDIYLDEKKIQIMTTDEISPFILTNLTSIKNTSVKLELKPLKNLIEMKETWHEFSTTVSSLRLDNILKEIYNISRQDSAAFIKKGYVKINFKIIDNTSFQVQVNDMISLRGKGRSKLTSIGSKTRKDRVRISFAVLR